ncbi:Uncharacterized protein OBRU01_14791 [Operophtera brumata]|uniref:Lipase domain-containing protein n=1 Tax=Operophtera brumata TaxID=104452 RepID=A0A0L7L5L8_OPEBR|nr:Uncharacterized protein OBRU01_14791 [Operophtera brumata]
MEQWEQKRARTRSKRSQGSVCYGEFGCFEDAGPFAYLETLPSSPQEVNTQFLMYSTVSRYHRSMVGLPCGWMVSSRQYLLRRLFSGSRSFHVSCEAAQLGRHWLAEYIDLRYEDIHLIGFSLGAHVAGFAGSELRNISRITGLDPAGPLFEFQDPRARLDRSDAKFVDVIHSNGETLILGGLGAAQPLGHVDFFPNGGRVQHGCSNFSFIVTAPFTCDSRFVGAVSDLLPWAAASVEGRSLCNHRRAYKFFTDSVSPKCHFPAFPCANYDTFLELQATLHVGRNLTYKNRNSSCMGAHQYHVSIWAGNEAPDKSNFGRVTLTLQGDSGLNESFPMTKREDSLNGGARFTRVIVPHPALGVPIRATIHYAAYNGWLSAGVKSILVDKLLIADSFAKTSSFCKKGLQLLSEESVELPLYPGDCVVPPDDQSFNGTNDTQVNTKENSTKREAPIVIRDDLDNELSEEPPQRPFALVDTYEWTGEAENTGRAFGMTNTKTAPSGLVEIAEPVLRPRLRKTPRQRADNPDGHEISEPVLRATQPPKSTTQPPLIRKAKNYDMSTTPTYDSMTSDDRAEKEESSFAVQFLPARLASFISRAERYARDTLLPLVSAYAPRLPIFGARELPTPTARYIPMEDMNVTSSVPVPTPTLEMKIESLRSVGPPGEKREMETPEDPDIPIVVSTTTTSTTTVAPLSTTTTEKLRPAPTEMLKVVQGPVVSASTALPSVALQSEGNEKIMIVYPSNARDERKIKSLSYPEEMQFEALYRHTAAPSDLRVDLPTFTPPTTTHASITTSLPKTEGRFIPFFKTDVESNSNKT